MTFPFSGSYQDSHLLGILAVLMKASKTIYLSIGSNLGHRAYHLQKAIFLLQSTVGSVTKISRIYESPAWGFTGEAFLNACLQMQTFLSPEEVLDQCLSIEQKLGRVRTASQNYTSRTLDIDILYIDKELIETHNLIIPHPKLHLRRFVLAPLADIAPQYYHPVFQKDTRNLLQECRDDIEVTIIPLKLYPNEEAFFSQLQFIAIEGNIGSGKTTLAQKIATDYNAKLVLERFSDNPFCPSFMRIRRAIPFP